MRTTWIRTLSAALVAAVGIVLLPAAQAAEDEWTFGIGTGITLLDLDGDIGFADDDGGVILELDLDNGETSDMLESGIGFAGFANKGRWTIHFGFGTLTLEDSDADLDAEWDRVEANLAVEYAFYQAGNHTFGILGGVRMYDHEWEFNNKITGEKSEPEDDWTDAVIGLTHSMPFAGNWRWANRAEYMGGDSEGGYTASTSVSWMAFENWTFVGSLRYQNLEFGDEDDINDNDFYLYDVDEFTTSIGFLYTW